MLILDNNLKDFKAYSEIIEDTQLNQDLIGSLLGKEIGWGSYRTTYEYNLHPTKYVIKVENSRNLSQRCNITEQLIWEQVKELDGNLSWVKDWFAPILWVSPNGRLLVMERTYEKPNKKRPEYVPHFLMDVKGDNFGWIGNKFVCHDYGFLKRLINFNNKKRKINW